MRYQIIYAETLHQLEQMVNTELKHDWNVTGGLCALSHRDGLINPPQTTFAQAMIRSSPQPHDA
jgi:hypothetical protein